MTRRERTIREDHLLATFRTLADNHARARQRLVSARVWQTIQKRSGPPRRRESWLASSALIVFVAAAAALLTFVLARPGASEQARLEYRVLGGSLSGHVLRTTTEPASVAFSDGSHIQAAQHTTLTVDVLGPAQVSTRLVAGTLRVRVIRAERTNWRFLAGPYEVRVIGTVFDVSWAPVPERLSIVMQEGEVEVVLPGPELRRVRAGQRFDWPMPSPSTAPPEAAESPAPDKATKRLPKAQPTGDAPAPSWSKLVSSGRFAEVVALADREGVARVYATKPATELKALALAARYTGDSLLELRTWRQVRSRFAGTTIGRDACFFSARVQDDLGNVRGALGDFDTYLRESPSGAYVSEALGRKLSLVRRVHGDSAAEPLARQYLAQFPHGAYAQTARALSKHE